MFFILNLIELNSIFSVIKMTENQTFYVKFKDNRAVGVETHIFVSKKGEWIQKIFSVGQLISAYKLTVAPRFASTPTDELTLHFPSDIYSAADKNDVDFSTLFESDVATASFSPPLLNSSKLSSPLFKRIDELHPLIISNEEISNKSMSIF